MLAIKFGTTPMKKADTQQFVIRIIIAFVFLGLLLYASIVFSNEPVVTQSDSKTTWKMTIQPRETFIKKSMTTEQPSDTQIVIPVQYTQAVNEPNEIPPSPVDIPAPVILNETSEVSEASCTSSGLTYLEIYRSIPFSRAEYLANPSYRHEATMEILMGQLRPTVIHKTYRPRVQGSFPQRLPYRTHYQIAPLDRYGSGFYPRYNRPYLNW